MAFDGIVLNAICSELNQKLQNGKIDKIYQPEKDEIILNIRNEGSNYLLKISSNSSIPKIHITAEKKKNPEVPPMFCMLLRKHIQGGKISKIEQAELERILYIRIQSYNELGDLVEKTLAVEIMGKHSNIILLDANHKITDSIKRVSFDISRTRQILPGMLYSLPSNQHKLDIRTYDLDNLAEMYLLQSPSTDLCKFVYTTFMGLSPNTARAILNKSGLLDNLVLGEMDASDKNKLLLGLKSFKSLVSSSNYSPALLLDQHSHYFDFTATGSLYPENIQDTHPSISFVVENFYSKKENNDQMQQRTLDLRKTISNKLDKNIKKIAKLEDELLEAAKRDKYRVYGELLTAYLGMITPGAKSLECLNYYTNETIIIPLDEKINGAKNAQKYFKKYAKLKTAHKLLTDQIEQTRLEILYLDNLLTSILHCESLDELHDIVSELIEENIIRKKSDKKTKRLMSKPLHFISSDGIDIYVGKNNYQNDFLTLKLSDKTDIWLHAKDMPGSHVIIKSTLDDLPDRTLEEAAMLAAHYSKARHSSTVPIDYAIRKNVKKPKSAKPGMVIYDQYYTLYITPEEAVIDALQKNK